MSPPFRFRSKPFVYSRKYEGGFTLIEAVLGIGLLAILIGTNMGMISSFFSLRDQQLRKHDFYDSLKVLTTQISNKAVCNAVMDSLTPKPFQIANLTTPLTISQIQLPFQPPLLKTNNLYFNNTLRIDGMKIALAQGVPTPGMPNAYLWLTLDYTFLGQPLKPGSLQRVGEFSGTKAVLYEVGLASAIISGVSVEGFYQTGSCQDFTSKRDAQISNVMCLIFLSNTNNGKCDLFDNPGIRETACTMTGYQYGGRFCDITKPL